MEARANLVQGLPIRCPPGYRYPTAKPYVPTRPPCAPSKPGVSQPGVVSKPCAVTPCGNAIVAQAQTRVQSAVAANGAATVNSNANGAMAAPAASALVSGNSRLAAVAQPAVRQIMPAAVNRLAAAPMANAAPNVAVPRIATQPIANL
ncbi:hypothetical protein LPJ57_007567, partial [Coemansia sp. RSA 486]